MKTRSDFVTNSSSSSFVLAFNSKDDFDEFNLRCDDFGYRAFFRLIKRMMKHDEAVDKNAALKMLRSFYRFEKINENEMMEAYAKDRGKRYWYEVSDEANNDPDYQAEIERRLAATDYAEQKQRIENAEIVVSGTIWDSDGGLLEWAIRNGFIKDEFWKYCILSWNVG